MVVSVDDISYFSNVCVGYFLSCSLANDYFSNEIFCFFFLFLIQEEVSNPIDMETKSPSPFFSEMHIFIIYFYSILSIRNHLFLE